MILQSLVMCAALAIPKHEPNCTYETYTFFTSNRGDFCIETRETCFFDDRISDFYYIACYRDRLFVGNFEGGT